MCFQWAVLFYTFSFWIQARHVLDCILVCKSHWNLLDRLAEEQKKALGIKLRWVGCGWPKISQDAKLPIIIVSQDSSPCLDNSLYPNKPIYGLSTSFFKQKNSISKWILDQVNKLAYTVTKHHKFRIASRDWRRSRHQLSVNAFVNLKMTGRLNIKILILNSPFWFARTDA